MIGSSLRVGLTAWPSRKIVFFALLVLSVATQGSSQDLTAKFEILYRSARTLSATFLQTYSENGRTLRVESGGVLFSHPGKMRWDYEKPEKNVFIVDGKYAWFFTPEDRTVTRTPSRESDDSRAPLALLAAGAKLSRICSRIVPAILPGGQPDPGASGFACQLRKDEGTADDSTSHRVWFELRSNGELSRILMQAPGGVQTEFRFKDWRFNPQLPNSLFRFAPPPGVVIIDGLLPSSPGARQ